MSGGSDDTTERRVESGGSPGQAAGEGTEQTVDPETEDVLEELQEGAVDETPPVESMAKVQEWQQRVEED